MAISKKSVLPERKPQMTRKRTVEVPMIFAARRRSNKVGPTKALQRDNTREIEIIKRSYKNSISFWYYTNKKLTAVDSFNDPTSYFVGKRLIDDGKSISKEVVSDVNSNAGLFKRSRSPGPDDHSKNGNTAKRQRLGGTP